MMKKGNLLIGGIALILGIVLIAFYMQSESTREFYNGLCALIETHPLEALVPVLFFLIIIACLFVFAIQVSFFKGRTEIRKKKKNDVGIQKNLTSKPITKQASKPAPRVKSVV